MAGQSSSKRCPEGTHLKNYISEVKVRADGVELPRLDSKRTTGSVDTARMGPGGARVKGRKWALEILLMGLGR